MTTDGPLGGRLAGKVAFITGAASGIGRERAMRGVVEGERGGGGEGEGGGTGGGFGGMVGACGEAVCCTTDVAVEAVVARAIADTEEAFGRLDVLFNNAGIMHPGDGDAQTTEEAVWDLTMAVNLKGVWFGCRHGIPALRRSGGGSVINTASFVALVGAATPQLAYTASKGGVLAMTRELAVIHAREGIRVNALCPGPLRTDLLMSFLDTEEKRQRRLVHVPMGRFGEAGEIARAALWLASDESSYVTGTDFSVDGGLTAAYVTPE